MSFYDYKFLHVSLMILYIFGLMTSSYNPKKILAKIFLAVTSLGLFISGVMLLNRFGIPLSGPYPLWVWAKVLISTLLLVLPLVIIKKIPQYASKVNFIFILLILAASFFGIFKP